MTGTERLHRKLREEAVVATVSFDAVQGMLLGTVLGAGCWLLILLLVMRLA